MSGCHITIVTYALAWHLATRHHCSYTRSACRTTATGRRRRSCLHGALVVVGLRVHPDRLAGLAAGPPRSGTCRHCCRAGDRTIARLPWRDTLHLTARYSTPASKPWHRTRPVSSSIPCRFCGHCWHPCFSGSDSTAGDGGLADQSRRHCCDCARPAGRLDVRSRQHADSRRDVVFGALRGRLKS